MGVVLQRQNETHYQNPDGSYTALISDGLNYLSNGEWKDGDTYYLVGTGDGAWSNESDQYPMTLVGGVVSTPDGWWQVEGIYAGDTKLWTPDFGNYGKIGDSVTYLTPWGTLKYTIRPDSYTEVFTFDRNPLAGTLYDSGLTIKYLGGVDSVVWAYDARNRSVPVNGSLSEKTVSRDDLYRAAYPLRLDPTDSFGASGDAYAKFDDYLYVYSHFNTAELLYGSTNDGGKWNFVPRRSLIRFNLASLSGATVTSATLSMVGTQTLRSDSMPQCTGTTSTDNPDTMSAYDLYNATFSGTDLGPVPSVNSSAANLSNAALDSYIQSRVGTWASIGLYNYQMLHIMGVHSSNASNASLRPSLSITYTESAPEPTLNASVIVGGVWKSATELHVNVSGVWKTATELQVNDGGWKS